MTILPSSSTARPLVLILVIGTVLLLIERRSQQHMFGPSSAHALSTAATTPPPPNKLYRILCYGDSLTAGTSPPSYQVFPYAPFLEQALNSLLPKNNRFYTAQVRHVGLPGWTSQQMVDTLSSDNRGLVTTLQRVKDPAITLTIILAGTNDLGHGYRREEITENLLRLHEAALEYSQQTLAIAIPPSGYTSQNVAARTLADGVNQDLQAFANKEPRTTFVEFPFGFERNGENWSSDTLHFSPLGYQRLGEGLATNVDEILRQII